MSFLISWLYPSYVEGASCYASEVGNLQLAQVDLSQIGKKNNLRFTGEISLKNRPKGICEGFALLFISYCLQQSADTKLTLSQLRKFRKIVLSRHSMECFILQKMQNNLLGVHGKPDQKILEEYKRAIDELPDSELQINVRSIVLKNNESSQTLTPDFYATILEIEGLYQARINPNAHRFHNLEMDVLHELLEWLKLKSLGKIHFQGNIEDLRRELSNLTSGVYHISLRKHAFAYIVDEEGCGIMCDVNAGIKPFKKDHPQEFNWTLRSYVEKKPQWITISRCVSKRLIAADSL